jgi:hypothetical protein
MGKTGEGVGKLGDFYSHFKQEIQPSLSFPKSQVKFDNLMLPLYGPWSYQSISRKLEYYSHSPSRLCKSPAPAAGAEN